MHENPTIQETPEATGVTGGERRPAHPHLDHDHVGAVFADRTSAEVAIKELREQGLGNDRLGVAIRDDAAVEFECDAAASMVRDTEVGVAAGAPIGAVAGIVFAALTATGAGALVGVGGLLAIGGASGLMGGVLGGYLGVAAGFDDWDEHQLLRYLALRHGEVLVVVCGDDRPSEVRTVMEGAGGRLVTSDGSPVA